MSGGGVSRTAPPPAAPIAEDDEVMKSPSMPQPWTVQFTETTPTPLPPVRPATMLLCAL